MKRDSSPALQIGSAIFLVAMANVFIGAGCGGSMPAVGDSKTGAQAEMASPPPPPPERLESMTDAEALMAHSEYDLRHALGLDKQEYQGQFAQPPASPVRPDETRSAHEEATDHKPKDAEAKAATTSPAGAATPMQQSTADSAGGSVSPCVTACKALASMDRAASHICSLAGDDDSRCTNARERVRSATERVRQSCPDCGS